MPVMPMPKLAPVFASCSLSHSPCDGVAHGSVGGDKLRRHIDAAHFGIIRIGDKALEKDNGSARHVCNTICEQTSGAGFGEGKCFLQLGETSDDHLFNEIALRGDDMLAERFEHPRFNLLEHGRRGAIRRKSTSFGRAQ